ncbi:hypothetical protein D3C85_1863730 [compost metagenome]
MENSLGVKSKKSFMEMQPGDVRRTWADTNLLNNLGYKSSITIEEGVGKFVQWYKNYFCQ